MRLLLCLTVMFSITCLLSAQMQAAALRPRP